MVRVGLEICATLENVEKLTTCFPDYAFFLKLKCSNCGEISDKWHAVQESEYTHQDSRNPDGFNFYMKCKLCGRENSINVEPPSNGYYMHDDSGRFKMIVLFDCRGVDPVEFSPRVGWVVESVENGETFDCVDLSEGDWVDYDQKNNNSVGVYDFQSRFVKEKKK